MYDVRAEMTLEAREPTTTLQPGAKQSQDEQAQVGNYLPDGCAARREEFAKLINQPEPRISK